MNELIFFFNNVIVAGVVLGSIYAVGAIGVTLIGVPIAYVVTRLRSGLAAVLDVIATLPFAVAGTVLAVVLLRSGGPGAALPQVGPMPSPWPQPSLPRLDWARLPELLSLALAMTIVALGQTISISVVVPPTSAACDAVVYVSLAYEPMKGK